MLHSTKICFVQVHLGQKYYAPQVQPKRALNSWPPDHESTFHVTEMPALTTWPSVTSWHAERLWICFMLGIELVAAHGNTLLLTRTPQHFDVAPGWLLESDSWCMQCLKFVKKSCPPPGQVTSESYLPCLKVTCPEITVTSGNVYAGS